MSGLGGYHGDRRASAEEAMDGRSHRYGGGRNGRGGRPRERDQRHYDHGRGSRGGHGPGAGMKAPKILSRKPDSAPIMPGAVSIMQRESSGSRLPTTSPPIRSITSPGSLGSSEALSSHHGHPHQSHRQRRTEGLSSSPSNYTPLQPSSRGGGGSRGDLNSVLSRPAADNLTQSNEMSHSVKMVDRNWHWEDKGLDYMLEQSDFVVVGVLGKQGVGKSTVMSLLSGTRTGAGKPFMFKTESKEVHESGGFTTTGVDMIVSSERVILLDTQPILSEALLDQYSQNESLVPSNMGPDIYLELMSLQMAIFLYTVCHVVLVVMDTMESSTIVNRFLWTVEQMKATCVKGSLDLPPEVGDKTSRDYYPQLVFVLNHASQDDFQPLSLQDMHLLLADNFQGAKVNIAGGVSLAKSGLVPIGRGLPSKKSSDTVDPGEVNLHLLPTNQNASDTYGVYCATRPEKSETSLNPVFKLLPSFTGHPSFQLLSETLRNQIFAMPRPPLRRTAQQQLTEREWFELARRVWLVLKKTDLYTEYDRILQATPPD